MDEGPRRAERDVEHLVDEDEQPTTRLGNWAQGAGDWRRHASLAFKIAVLGIVGLGVVSVAVIVGSAAGSGDDTLADDIGTKWGAESTCEGFVEWRLKAPSTAEYRDTATSYLGDRSWKVVGSVDSANSFGAMLRNRYTCTVQLQPALERWQLVDLRFSEH